MSDEPWSSPPCGPDALMLVQYFSTAGRAGQPAAAIWAGHASMQVEHMSARPPAKPQYRFTVATHAGGKVPGLPLCMLVALSHIHEERGYKIATSDGATVPGSSRSSASAGLRVIRSAPP